MALEGTYLKGGSIYTEYHGNVFIWDRGMPFKYILERNGVKWLWNWKVIKVDIFPVICILKLWGEEDLY